MSYDHLRAIRDSALPATERAVLNAVVLRAGDDGCWASQATIALDTGLGERTVRRDLARLVAGGLLLASHRPGRTTTYTLGATPAPRATPAPDATPAPRARAPAPPAGPPRHDVPPTPAPRADEMPTEEPKVISRPNVSTPAPAEDDLAEVAAALMGVPLTALSSGDLHAITHHDATTDDLRALWRWRSESPEWVPTCARRDRWGWRLLLAVGRGLGIERLRAARQWVATHTPPCVEPEAARPRMRTLDELHLDLDSDEARRDLADFDRMTGGIYARQ